MSEPPEEFLTLRDWLRHAVSRFGEAGLFFGHGCDNAWDEAAYLLLHALHLPLDRLEPFLDARLTREECRRLSALIARRVEARLPAAYLTNEAWLGDFRFYVDPRVIVPRSYIAELLPDALSPWVSETEAVGSALDLCTGSGCLAVLLAHAFPNALIDAADLSAGALEVARRNVADYGLERRIRLVRSDLFEALAGRRYDVIVSNPPYVGAEAMTRLPAETRHEPVAALAAGEDGLDFVRRILARAGAHLGPEGILVVEVGHLQAAVEAAFPEVAFTWLATASSEDAVFLLQADQLPAAAPDGATDGNTRSIGGLDRNTTQTV
ncbi:MAG TPA: 50S ribosomal protein L3 N(5)-glutamine methyltransferase [Rhodocyclaceae bacterium]|nr:MAG: ribosomal protein L3 N(5)-glutamine methyltransferase [Betaproteobacteria bacterium CG2_30_68_42]PIV71811.1 MAG: 50S ribosomal protein L3 N(5)-glutamine methyltransferase [Rhodocyclales bacterium CG17_big_fil_post_rev_8_21_14_2_50_68_7]PIX75747.1 MAG: 50S ribosomal protein L3 N(5)-glutamine methyltransferase [Rhodocyclales bacterium CG_4_10_14_3_um_filter_68_10]PJA57563.1 MAG: 50S ribosomal protein L3 N(5)-glutamine methyltransferase [Rhodocyclales bacterium CG_4_9_14_3_um_filter_68_10]